MELKDFIKSVLFDVTEAVKECQEELKNGAIISPSNRSAEEKVRAVSGDLKISYIDFEVAVSASSENLNNGEKTGGVEVSGSVIGVRFGGKFGGKSVSEENKQVNENVSKIKFSIPVIYPTQPVLFFHDFDNRFKILVSIIDGILRLVAVFEINEINSHE